VKHVQGLDSAVPVACWSGSIGHNDSTRFARIAARFSLRPAAIIFLFSELEPKLNLDLTALEHEFHHLSRKLHPDRFARALDERKQWSLADTALLNDAYRRRSKTRYAVPEPAQAARCGDRPRHESGS